MNHKVPVEFLIYTKRGSSYNKRRIILLKDELQYYELEGEYLIKPKLIIKYEDLIIKEDNENEYKIRLFSKTKSFSQIKIKDLENKQKTKDFFNVLGYLVRKDKEIKSIQNKVYYLNDTILNKNENIEKEVINNISNTNNKDNNDLKSTMNIITYDINTLSNSNIYKILNQINLNNDYQLKEFNNMFTLETLSSTKVDLKEILNQNRLDLYYTELNMEKANLVKGNNEKEVNDNNLTYNFININLIVIALSSFLVLSDYLLMSVSFLFVLILNLYYIPSFTFLKKKVNQKKIVKNNTSPSKELDRNENNLKLTEEDIVFRCFRLINLPKDLCYKLIFESLLSPIDVLSNTVINSNENNASSHYFDREIIENIKDKSILIVDYLKTLPLLLYRIIQIEHYANSISLVTIYSKSSLSCSNTYNFNMKEYYCQTMNIIKLIHNYNQPSHSEYDSIFISKDNIEEEINSNKKKTSLNPSSKNENIENNEEMINNKEIIEKETTNIKENIKKEVKNQLNNNLNLLVENGLDDKGKEYLIKNRESFDYFKRNYENCEWKSYIEETKLGLLGFYYDDKEGRRAIKGTITILKPINIVYSYLKQLENKIKYDKSYEKGNIINKYNDYFSTAHIIYKGKITFSQRDFMVSIYTLLKDGIGELFSSSFPTDKSTHVKSIVRGNVVFNYYNLKDIEGSKTFVEFYVLSETGLSQYLVNLVLKDIVLSLEQIKILIEKN